jgi:hypothetical protein
MTQRMASTMFDLPQPFGPTIDVIGSGNEIDVLSTKDLNPKISMRLIFKARSSWVRAKTEKPRVHPCVR